MSSLSKQKNCTKELDIKQCDDRITSLPNCLITKILSCLPTKEAVATSVLSTKWKRSWMSITNLDFNDNLSIHGRYKVDKDAHKFRKFTDFVTRVLLLRERSCLQKVSLRCYRDCDDSFVNEWLSTIVQCNVQVLFISIWFHKDHPDLLLSSDIFHCSTLVVLELWGNVKIPSSACLPALRTLDLRGICIDDEASFTTLLSGCHVLEELKLCEILGDDMHVVNITSHVLKKLIIESNAGQNIQDEFQIVIDTPALEYLDLDADYAYVRVPSKMNHLIKADIQLAYGYTHENNELYTEAITDLVKGISQVQTLVLSCATILSIRSCDLVLPIFSKLTYLKLHMAEDRRWSFLVKLLENSPCLATLYIEQERAFDGKGPDTLPFHDPPPCFLSHLKEVEIEVFEYVDIEMKVVEYILKNAKVLDKLILHYSPNDDEIGPDLAEALQLLPKTSAVCKVVVL